MNILYVSIGVSGNSADPLIKDQKIDVSLCTISAD